MFVILFYDIQNAKEKEKNNARKVQKLVEKYLARVQFSVFEGEIRKSDLKLLTDKLKKACVQEFDSIIIYSFENQKYSYRTVIGVDKNESLFS
ncbi:CRISPR/Cas system-associated endoribonuclease Cas2, type I-B/HMARI [Campylobacter iguaniorum]|uniref:CRISPR-associated endoribonuclease Cas2 n=1 Tax=Campylobacter iguaniorum TaxID=1244531 RepID=A0A076FF43_9BACT|nr:CRISPR-associated endonuclease Cas2 [Campylobacter iguaniorum]AII14454.1 CRISPR/Cas system-associated endoribonuclease Cas2, type I-B/HMARI [Campylobacter iguaniorum]ALV24189.1 CRISPR/Cas system-associated endoribonuclease Cas2, type I-B/HMARI [Campylobacter iguaniorum]